MILKWRGWVMLSEDVPNRFQSFPRTGLGADSHIDELKPVETVDYIVGLFHRSKKRLRDHVLYHSDHRVVNTISPDNLPDRVFKAHIVHHRFIQDHGRRIGYYVPRKITALQYLPPDGFPEFKVHGATIEIILHARVLAFPLESIVRPPHVSHFTLRHGHFPYKTCCKQVISQRTKVFSHLLRFHWNGKQAIPVVTNRSVFNKLDLLVDDNGSHHQYD